MRSIVVSATKADGAARSDPAGLVCHLIDRAATGIEQRMDRVHAIPQKLGSNQ
jgi:hypothetical protein